jgi:hypothetical protein
MLEPSGPAAEPMKRLVKVVCSQWDEWNETSCLEQLDIAEYFGLKSAKTSVYVGTLVLPKGPFGSERIRKLRFAKPSLPSGKWSIVITLLNCDVVYCLATGSSFISRSNRFLQQTRLLHVSRTIKKNISIDPTSRCS